MHNTYDVKFNEFREDIENIVMEDSIINILQEYNNKKRVYQMKIKLPGINISEEEQKKEGVSEF